MYLVLSCTVIRELKQRRRRRQQERPNNFARASRFFVPFFAVVARLQRESAWIHVLSRTGTQDNNFLFFSWTLIQSFRIQLQKHLPTFDEVNEME